MCLHFQTSDMLEWLKTQVRVLEAWREDMATRPELDLEMIVRLEHHYQWLTKEVRTLEDMRPRWPESRAGRSLAAG